MKVIAYDKVWFHGHVRPAEYTLPITGLSTQKGKVKLTRVIDDWEDTLHIEGHGNVARWEVPWTHVACAVRTAPVAERPTEPSPPETKPEPKPKAPAQKRSLPQQRPKMSAAQMLSQKDAATDGA